MLYAGSGIRGYGNFVMILADNGEVTAYAHCLETYVFAGDRPIPGWMRLRPADG